mgnify:CR=1 FL=1
MNYLIVGLGGAIGAMSRYGVMSILIDTLSAPIITLCINSFGSFALGFLFYTVQQKSNQLYLFLTTGMLSGFTTFSTFSLDVVKLLQNEHYLNAAFISVVSLLGCILFAYIGAVLAKVGFRR